VTLPPEEERLAEAEHLARYQLAAELAAGRSVLDAGCGAGYGAALLARAGAERVTGIDSDAAALDFARERYGDQVRFERGNLMALPFEDDSFGLAVCFGALGSPADPGATLDELARVLAPGGVLVVDSDGISAGELAEALAARWGEVRMMRQRLRTAMVIGAEQGTANGASPSLRTLAGEGSGRDGDELGAVALAGEAPLPELPELVVLAAGVAARQMRDAAAAWERRARVAEAERDAISIEMAEIGRRRATAVEELEELRRRLAAAGRRGRRFLRRG
jgi:SAM-dependent methyltransferase